MARALGACTASWRERCVRSLRAALPGRRAMVASPTWPRTLQPDNDAMRQVMMVKSAREEREAATVHHDQL